MMIASWVGGLNAILNYMQTLENFQLVSFALKGAEVCKNTKERGEYILCEVNLL